MSRRTIAAVVAGLATTPTLALIGAAPAAAASDGGVQVSNTETVQAYLDPTGKLDVARVYEQVAMRGTGSVDLSNPVETQGLRNLDGFGGFDVKNGAMVGHYDVAGEQRLRTVSDYTKKLPLQVQATYTLDGKPIEPGDLVGRSGRLEVRYTVRNVTGTSQVVTYDDGTGKTASSTEEVVIPMVGSLTTTLPSTYTNVGSAEANLAGDGRGGTKLTFTMTLFGPIGTPTASFGYAADIVDGTLPKASISALPVSPLDSPSFKGGAESYKGGATTGATLTAGATEIDTNLLKLRDGAGTLLAGLLQLRDGAKKLDAGLGAQALPGSRDLASGAGQLKDGTARLRSGAGAAKDGSSQVAAGAAQVHDGAAQLDGGAGRLAGGLHLVGENAPLLLAGLSQVAGGLDKLDDGLTQFYAGAGEIPAAAKPLHDGIAKLRAGIGSSGQTGTLVDGVEQIRAGLAAAVAQGGSVDQLKGGVDQSKGGVDQSKAGVDQSKGGVDQSKGGVDQVRAGLVDALSAGGGINQLKGGVNAAKGADCGVTCQAILGQVALGIEDLRGKTQAAADGLGQVSGGLGQVSGGLGQVSGGLGQVSGGLGQVSGGLGLLKGKLSDAAQGLARVECGLSNASLSGVCDPAVPGLMQGLQALDAGVDTYANGVMAKVRGTIGGTSDTSQDKTLRGGVNDLQVGVGLLGQGGNDLLFALGLLTNGANQLKGGTSQLRSGSGDLASGANQLDGGVGQLADGANQVDDGAGQVSDGAGRLSDGVAQAASGTSRLAAGLDDAAAGAPALENGAQRLSDEGTKKLVEAGKATAADYGEKYALIEVGARRAKAEGMAYGAPVGASAATAYSLELAGVDGEAEANVGRTVAAAALFGLAGAAFLVRRRLG